MAYRYEIGISGSGGQGIILAGIILAEAAGIYEGRYVAQSQSYGAEARGGISKTEVVISDEEIDYPKAIGLDLLLAMSQTSYDKCHGDLKNEGILIVDSTFINNKGYLLPQVYSIPFTKIAENELGSRLAANIIALGAISQIIDIVSPSSIEKAISNRIPETTMDINKKAFMAGIKATTG